MRVLIFIVACIAAWPAAAQTEPGGALRVHVVNSITGAPIAGANVVADQKAVNLWGRTDAAGIFIGRTQAHGSYLLTVTHKGYRMTERGMGKVIEVRAGTGTEVTVAMQPCGVIAGRVLDQYGDPVRHAIVRTEDKVSLPGRTEYYESYSAETTDDLGEYRLLEVSPGKHYVTVEYDSVHDERSSGVRSRYRWPQTGGLLLYPDGTDLDQAQQVEVAAGAATRLNDMRLNIRPAAVISGRITPTANGAKQSVSLERADQLAFASTPMIQDAQAEADGSFKVSAWPGKYVLKASGQGGQVSKPLTLEVREKDITRVELELTNAYEVSGTFVVDGPERIDFSKLNLIIGGADVKVDTSGMFHTNLSGNRGFYVLHGLPEDWYVKRLQVAGKTITGRQFTIEPGRSDMTITLGPRGASLSIGVEGAADNGLSAVYALLLPEGGEVPDLESVLEAQVDASGRFTIHGIPPGSYRVFTLDVSNWFLVMRPDMLSEQHRKLVPLISLTEGERKSIVIPIVKIQIE